jgi:hypothetical protein
MAMERNLYKAFAAAGMAVFLLSAGRSAAADDREAPTVILDVMDLTGSAPEDLEHALTQTTKVFDGIGVRVVWLSSGGDSQPCDCRGVRLSVRLLSPFLVRELTKRGVKKAVLGSASTPEALAYIYTERVTALAAGRRMDERVLLGLVIAHEVGHLVLPGKGHSRTGIMTEGIDTDPLGLRQRFTPEEGRAIRAFLKAKATGGPVKAASAPHEHRGLR